MSALGQKQTFAMQNVMSALPPIADIFTSLCPLSAISGHCDTLDKNPAARRLRFGSMQLRDVFESAL